MGTFCHRKEKSVAAAAATAATAATAAVPERAPANRVTVSQSLLQSFVYCGENTDENARRNDINSAKE